VGRPGGISSRHSTEERCIIWPTAGEYLQGGRRLSYTAMDDYLLLNFTPKLFVEVPLLRRLSIARPHAGQGVRAFGAGSREYES